MRKLARTLTDTPEALAVRIEEMERKLDRLRALYESFFMGVERQPPNTPRREMNRLMLETQQIPIANASLRFRFQTLVQRWVLYTSYWNRTLREIEAGTYRRDLAKARRHIAARGGAISEQEALALGIPSSRVKAFVGHQQKRLDAAEARKAPARAGEPSRLPGVTDAQVEALFAKYLDAHRASGSAKPPPTLEKVRDRLAAQLPRILEANKCKNVKLDVVVEDGKAKLRVWPQKD